MDHHMIGTQSPATKLSQWLIHCRGITSVVALVWLSLIFVGTIATAAPPWPTLRMR